MARRFLTLLLALGFLLAAAPSHAERVRVFGPQAITEASGTVTVTVGHGGRPGAAYLVLTTTSEVATASMASTVNMGGTGNVLCIVPAITTETTTLALIGRAGTASAGVSVVCPMPLADQTTLSFVVTGTGAGFTVAADLVWIQ